MSSLHVSLHGSAVIPAHVPQQRAAVRALCSPGPGLPPAEKQRLDGQLGRAMSAGGDADQASTSESGSLAAEPAPGREVAAAGRGRGRFFPGPLALAVPPLGWQRVALGGGDGSNGHGARWLRDDACAAAAGAILSGGWQAARGARSLLGGVKTGTGSWVSESGPVGGAQEEGGAPGQHGQLLRDRRKRESVTPIGRAAFSWSLRRCSESRCKRCDPLLVARALAFTPHFQVRLPLAARPRARPQGGTCLEPAACACRAAGCAPSALPVQMAGPWPWASTPTAPPRVAGVARVLWRSLLRRSPGCWPCRASSSQGAATGLKSRFPPPFSSLRACCRPPACVSYSRSSGAFTT